VSSHAYGRVGTDTARDLTEKVLPIFDRGGLSAGTRSLEIMVSELPARASVVPASIVATSQR
jgi:hypothetical protein